MNSASKHGGSPLPIEVRVHQEQIFDEFEAAWQEGDRPSIEELVATAVGLERSELLRQLLLIEWDYRLANLENPEPKEYLARFPADQDLIQEVLNEEMGSASKLAATRSPRFSDQMRPKRSFGAYVIEDVEPLGKGGMGVVYRARQVQLDRMVALKMMLKGIHATREELARFRQEAKTAASLQHPNIVKIHEVAEWPVEELNESVPFFSMELFEGGSLAERVKEAGVSTEGRRWAAKLVITVAQAVEYGHQQRVFHRDLKPANILFDGHGHPHVTDFGLAKVQNSVSSYSSSEQPLGTPNYMPPEQIDRKHEIGPEADVYGLGGILYELITGQPPFKAATPLDTMRKVLEEDPIPPRKLNQKIHRDLETICLKCLEKYPGNRYRSAQMLADDLERFINKQPIQARRSSVYSRLSKWSHRRPAAAALVATVALLVVGSLCFALQEIRWAYEVGERELAVRRVVFAQDTALGFRHWAKGQYVFVRDLLNKYRHPEVDQPDLRSFAWNHLCRLYHQDLFVIEGHAGPVFAVAYAPNGEILATASGDNLAKLWDPRTGKEIAPPLKGHSGPVVSLAFAPNSQMLATASEDKTVKLWHVSNHRLLSTLPEESEAVEAVGCVAFSPDGRTLAVGKHDGTVALWDVEEKPQLRQAQKQHAKQVTCLAFSPDGNYLASGSTDGTAKLWSLATKGMIDLPGHEDEVWSVAFNREGTWLATASIDDSVLIWEVAARGKQRSQIKGKPRDIFSVAFLAAGNRLVTGGRNGVIKIWDISGKELMPVITGHTGVVYSMTSAPNGTAVASGGADGLVCLWDPATGKSLSKVKASLPSRVSLQGHHGPVYALAFSPDGGTIAAGGKGSDKKGELKLWDASTGKTRMPLDGHESSILVVAFDPNGRFLASGSEDKTIKIWDMRTSRLVQTLNRHEKPVTSVAFSPDGRTLASASQDETVKIWDVATGKELRTLRGHRLGVLSVAFSPDGLTLASGSEDRTVKLWEMPGGRERTTLDGPRDYVNCVAFSKDGKTLAAASEDMAVTVWDVNSGRQKLVLRGHTGWVGCVTFSADGKTLASGSDDNTVILWDAATGAPQATFEDHEKMVRALAFSHDGKVLASAGEDQRIILRYAATSGDDE